MKQYRVTCIRTQRQEVSVTVNADSKDEAIEAVERGFAPAQWPDGNYVGEPGHKASQYAVVEVKA